MLWYIVILDHCILGLFLIIHNDAPKSLRTLVFVSYEQLLCTFERKGVVICMCVQTALVMQKFSIFPFLSLFKVLALCPGETKVNLFIK